MKRTLLLILSATLIIIGILCSLLVSSFNETGYRIDWVAPSSQAFWGHVGGVICLLVGGLIFYFGIYKTELKIKK